MTPEQAARYRTLIDPYDPRNERSPYIALRGLSEDVVRERIRTSAEEVLHDEGRAELKREIADIEKWHRRVNRAFDYHRGRDSDPTGRLSSAEVDRKLDELERLQAQRAEESSDWGHGEFEVSEATRDAEEIMSYMDRYAYEAEIADIEEEARISTLALTEYRSVLNRHRAGVSKPRRPARTAEKKTETRAKRGRPKKTVYIALAMYVLRGPDTKTGNKGRVRTLRDLLDRMHALGGLDNTARFSIGTIKFEVELPKEARSLEDPLIGQLEAYGKLMAPGEKGGNDDPHYFPNIEESVKQAYDNLFKSREFEPYDQWKWKG